VLWAWQVCVHKLQTTDLDLHLMQFPYYDSVIGWLQCPKLLVTDGVSFFCLEASFILESVFKSRSCADARQLGFVLGVCSTINFGSILCTVCRSYNTILL
jgi:hypothetical protein